MIWLIGNETIKSICETGYRSGLKMGLSSPNSFQAALTQPTVILTRQNLYHPMLFTLNLNLGASSMEMGKLSTTNATIQVRLAFQIIFF